MSGSSGASWSRVPKGIGLSEWTQKLETRTSSLEQATRIADTLSAILSEINAHDYDAIDRHRSQIQSALASEFELQNTRLGGTHARKTAVAGLSDVDMLASLGDFHEGISSDQAIGEFASRLTDRFPNTEIIAGKMAVTLRFSDGIEMQVLPAFKSGDGYLISDGNGGWKKTIPARFMGELTRLNQSLAGNLVPTIKLARALCEANRIEIAPYHLENIALRAFDGYSGSATPPDMLQHLLGRAKALCLTPIPDMTGQSPFVDESVSADQRRAMATKFRQAEQRLAKALKDGDMERLKALMEVHQ